MVEWMAVKTKIQLKEVTGHTTSSSISSLLQSRILSVVLSCVPRLCSAQGAMQDPWWWPSLPALSLAPCPRKPAFPVCISWGLSCYLTASSAHRWKGDVASRSMNFPFWRNANHECLGLLSCMTRKWTWWPLKACPLRHTVALLLLDAIVGPVPRSFGLSLHSDMIQNSDGTIG